MELLATGQGSFKGQMSDQGSKVEEWLVLLLPGFLSTSLTCFARTQCIQWGEAHRGESLRGKDHGLMFAGGRRAGRLGLSSHHCTGNAGSGDPRATPVPWMRTGPSLAS